MEMLTNIWNVISTENVNLTNYIVTLFSFVESYLSLMLFINLLNIKCSTKQKLLYVILSSVICTIMIQSLIPSPFNVIFNYLTVFIIIYFIFKQGFLKTLVALFLPVLIFGLTNVLILNVYIKVLNITYEECSIIPIYRFFYLIILYIVVAFIVFVFKHKNFKIKVLEDFDKKTKKVVLLNFIIGLFTVALQAFITFYYLDFAEIYVTFSNFIVLLVYFCINLYSLSKITKLTITTRELETSEAYNKSITILYDNVKGFKHDFDNIVSAIGGYVDTNDMEGLKEIIVLLEKIVKRLTTLQHLTQT